MTKRSWQCLQTEDEREILGNRKKNEVDEADREKIENWRGTFSRACVDSNASDLADLKADVIIA